MSNDTPLASLPAKSAVFLLTLCMMAPPLHAEADTRWLLCNSMTPPASQQTFNPETPLEFSADQASFDLLGITALSGNVEIRQGNRKITAAQVFYSHKNRTVRASGEIHYLGSDLEVMGDQARLNLQTNSGNFDNARYRLPLQHAHGTAYRLARTNENITRLQQVNYTTCNPGQVDWQLRASEIRLDQNSKKGTARNVSVRFKDVPFFYFPYMVFPITNERLSGFLMPDISINMSRNTTDIAIPYYWNIAPDYDATITPRIINRRGLMLGGEFRYLTSSGSGHLYGEYLADDRLYGDSRSLTRFRHRSQFSPLWSGAINYNYVNDADYFIDMGDSLNPITASHQERRLTLTYRDSSWLFSGTLLSYQMLLGTTPPYQKFPQLNLKYIGRQQDNQLNYHINGSYTYFDDDNNRQPTGSRLDTSAGISFSMRSQSSYLTPRITLHHTLYQLDNSLAEMASTPNRTVPSFSLDSGIFLERLTHWGNTAMLQTLEPRLFYLYIPYRNQSELPNFDTTAYTFDYTRLFRESRFTNVDRINDANQISAGITTRFLESSNGAEKLTASIGQIFYFEDRRVTLKTTDAAETAGISDIAAEF